jgi:branched-chain amino acid transport system permease protein
MAAVDVAALPRSDVPASIKIAFAVMVAVLVLAPLPPFQVYPVFLMKALCFALFACAFNLLIGYGGLLSFGHAMFFGWAAYVAAHIAKVGTVSLPYWAGAWNWLSIPLPAQSPALAIFSGALFAGILGVIVGAVAIRRQGIYFAMITLALAQMVAFFATEAPFTGGEDGIQAVPRGHILGFIDLDNTYTMYYFVLAVFVAGFALIQRTINSPFGQIMKAIRENEPRAVSLGYRTERYKLLAFVLSSALAGLAGATKVLVLQFASLSDVDWTTSGQVVLMTLVGGVGTPLGPVVGAFIIVTMENYLAQAGSWVTIIEGVIFVVCVLTFRRGIVGVLAPYLTSGSERKVAEPSAETP